MRLDAVEGRVLGSLIEKQLTTPQQYPLTLNALVLACNQASNRDPVTSLAESEVLDALERLKASRLVRFVLPSHGRSVVRYRQVLDEALGLDAAGLAVLAVLLLRGPQTPGELRSRTERMAALDGLHALEHELDRLAALDPPLVVRLGRRPGQKEDRWSELLSGPSTPSEDSIEGPTVPGEREESQPEPPRPEGAVAALLESFRAETERLRAEVDSLREELRLQREALETLRQSLGG